MTEARTCSEPGCDSPAKSRGRCSKHYMRLYLASITDVCLVDGCKRTTYGRTGLCGMHYKRKATTGTLGGGAPLVVHGVPWEERLFRWIDKNGPSVIEHPEMGQCWRWTGRRSNGYGSFDSRPVEGQRKRRVGVHRLVYELLVGPIPEGLTLDHVCHSLDLSCAGGDSCAHRACCNPAHLEPVTAVVNIGRGENARKVECHRGHDLTDPANLKPNSRGARQCRACSNIARADRYRRLGR